MVLQHLPPPPHVWIPCTAALLHLHTARSKLAAMIADVDDPICVVNNEGEPEEVDMVCPSKYGAEHLRACACAKGNDACLSGRSPPTWRWQPKLQLAASWLAAARREPSVSGCGLAGPAACLLPVTYTQPSTSCAQEVVCGPSSGLLLLAAPP